jgi:hypothetical protein
MNTELLRGRSAFLAIALAATPLDAQVPDTLAPSDTLAPDTVALVDGLLEERADSAGPRPGEWAVPLVILASPSEDRLRVDQLLGRASSEGYLIRSPSTLSPPPMRGGSRSEAALIPPRIRAVWNSALPFSHNEGPMWAGRGGSVQVTAGMRVRFGIASLILAPQLELRENRAFQTIPYPSGRTPERSEFASPWYGPPESMDLPLRFGEDPATYVDLGQSSLTIDLGDVAAGVATENLWWGPGIRNAIVMSSHAPGIPQLFLRTDRPIRSRLGSLEGRWIVGRLSESGYFDTVSANDSRSISGLVLTFTPALAPELTIGGARAVFASMEDRGWALTPFDVFRNVGRPNAVPEEEPLPDRTSSDQIFSLFGRWIFPESGFEAYGEWARFEQPASVRDLLIYPNHSQGYTVGLQWARPVRGTGALRLQAEFSYLEPTSTFRQRRVSSTYASRSVPQGYTHRGQVIGASIGPGASSQWFAGDYLGDRARIGAFWGRIRRNNAVLATATPFVATILHQDVTVFGGVRAGYRLGPMEAVAEFTSGLRYNYLFQNPSIDTRTPEGVDVWNRTIELYLQAFPG